MSEQALEVSELNFSYGKKQVLYDLTFQIEKGQCAFLLGPNGAGKSTLFSLITRLYDQDKNNIKLAGFDIKTQPLKALARLGVVFQQTTLDLDLSVKQNLLYHAALQGISPKKAKVLIQQQLEQLDMFERQNEVVRQLNGGHRRRVEIARALMHQPKLLLLDEPTVGLDIASRESIVKHVHQLCEHTGLAVLWATHLMDEVLDKDKIIMIHQGKIRAEGSRDDLMQQTSTELLSEAFFSLTNSRGE
ncbi:MAG: ABC transporter ATP-binding protein [Methyloprofundus sp.]|nr:ABC transporter ATP-binding protein [Methyloprofundus sp.]